MDTNPTTWDPDSQPSTGEVDKDLVDQPESGAVPSDDSSSDRSAQARIKELIARNKDLIEKLEVQRSTLPPAPEPAPEVKKVTEQIRNLGFTTDEEVNKRFQIFQDQIIKEAEHSRLESKFTGDNKELPVKYDRHAVEEYSKQKGIFDLEVAFEQMHKPEFIDWYAKQSIQKQQPYTPAPTSSQGREDNIITREKISQMMKTPQGRQWYEDNRDKILSLAQQGQLT